MTAATLAVYDAAMRSSTLALVAAVATTCLWACSSFSGADDAGPVADAGPSDALAADGGGSPAKCASPTLIDDPAAKADARCGPGGGVVDLMSSSDHCGACNHSCGLFSACEGGMCKPATLFQGQPIATALVAGATAYYVGTDKQIYKGDVNATSGTRLNLAAVEDAKGVRRLSADATWLYVSEATAQQRVSLVSTEANQLPLQPATDRGGIVALAKSGYFYASQAGIERYSAEGIITYVSPSPGTTTVVADGDDPFWLTAGVADVSLSARQPDGASKLLASTAGATVLALDAEYVYFADAKAQLIRRVPRSGGNTESVATEKATAFGDLAVDGDYLYWTVDRGDAWALVRVSRCGGLPLVLAKDLPRLSQLSFDETSVFVASYSNDNKSDLLRIPK